MAIDPLAEMVERLQRCGFEPREIGHDAWELRCPGHSSADHAMRLWRGEDGNLVMQCQSAEECSFTEDFHRAARHHRDPTTKPAVIVESPGAAIKRSLSQGPEPAVPASLELSLPVAALAAETHAPPRPDGAVEGQGILTTEGQGRVATIDIAEVESRSREVAVAATSEDSVRGDDADRSSTASGDDNRKTSATEKLLRIAAGARPFRRPDGQFSVSIAVDGHQECHALESPDVVRWLTRRYYESTGRLPSASALAATIRALAAHADIAGTSDADFVRVGSGALGSSIFVDLGDPTWRAIEIRHTGWQIVAKPAVHFRRSAGQRAPALAGERRLDFRSCKNLSTSSPPSCRS